MGGAATVGAALLGACGEQIATQSTGLGVAAVQTAPPLGGQAPASPAVQPTLGADQYVANAADIVAAVDWEKLQTVRVAMTEFSFDPKQLTFQAGLPYKVEIVAAGKEKHEFTAEDFYRSVAFRKAEDAFGEVKVPYFTEIEVFAGKQVDLYFVPMFPGTYPLLCEIEGHREAGMEGSITVTGRVPESPAPVLASVLEAPWVRNGSELVKAANWDAQQELKIELTEYTFKPDTLTLRAGQPYVLELVNLGQLKHEFTAEEFFQTVAFRKAEDEAGEFKAPAPKEIEVFAGKRMELFLIPTKEGVYDLVCEIEGHLEQGMRGKIVVEKAG